MVFGALIEYACVGYTAKRIQLRKNRCTLSSSILDLSQQISQVSGDAKAGGREEGRGSETDELHAGAGAPRTRRLPRWLQGRQRRAGPATSTTSHLQRPPATPQAGRQSSGGRTFISSPGEKQQHSGGLVAMCADTAALIGFYFVSSLTILTGSSCQQMIVKLFRSENFVKF